MKQNVMPEGSILTKLLSSQNLAANIINSVPAGISITTDISCKEIRHNPKAAEFLRIRSWETLSHTDSLNQPVKLIHNGKELTPAEMPIQRAAWNGEEVKNLELEFVWDDGVRKISVWNSSPLFNESGSIIGAVTTFEDITERKRAEANLAASEEKYRILHESMQDAFVSVTIDGQIIECNNAYLDLLGYTKEEFQDLSYISLTPAKWHAMEAEIVERQILARGFSDVYEKEYRRKDGKVFPVELKSFLIRDQAGDPLFMWAIIRDITQRRKMENELREHRDHLEMLVKERTRELEVANEKLRQEIKTRKTKEAELCESEERFRTAAESMLDCFAIFLAVRDESGQIVDFVFDYINEAACIDNNMTKEQHIGKSLIELIPVIGTSDLFNEYCRVVETGITLFKEFVLYKDNQQREISRAYDIRAAKLGDGLAISWRNVIDRKKAEEELRKSRQMEDEIARLDRLNLVGEMAAGIGHEVRNPMTTVKGFLQILREKDKYAQEREYFDLMVDELDRANSIITEFLSLAKNKAVDLEMRHLNKILKKLLPLIEADGLVTDKYIKLETKKIPDLLLDEKEIRQLVLNLVRNGLEAISPGGTIEIRTYSKENEVVLAVKDNGKGIEPKVLEKIGTPFFTTKDTGTGLGLAVCYSIAARHNARIDIETGAEGTTFFVRFRGPK